MKIDKKNHPVCWYCKRYFDDEKDLVLHQRDMHFKCPHCKKSLKTALGMAKHAKDIHNKVITTVNDEKRKKIKTKEQLAQHQTMMQNVPTADQSSGYNAQHNIPHQHSQFLHRFNLDQPYLIISPYRPGQISGVSQPPEGQIQPFTTGTSAIYSNNNIAPVSQIYSVGILPSDPSETNTDETILFSATQNATSQTKLPNIEILFRENLLLMVRYNDEKLNQSYKASSVGDEVSMEENHDQAFEPPARFRAVKYYEVL
ncbi:14640_t:CDS:2 [Funneliformis geosporum]|uniref:15782_t:CDS:1 n=1 Tax=Funneliformis geosporum TaxID=1117311 RepID=A0A9W4SYS3_9GLOM|nr:14640_t:CDS:2 [Funneliformis geosporum]CAI2186415.1 15782_t:CDS:2 [Funneliformis geosporum]